jgi:hypothetical protein
MYVVKGDLEGLKNSGKDNAEGFGKNLGFI